MHQNSTSRSQSSEGSGHTGRNRPRVVILDEGTSARVEVLELPEEVHIGASFCHSGTSWKVTGERPHSRVVIAEREN